MRPPELCRAALTAALVVATTAACSFDDGGVTGDGGGPAPDGPPGDRDGDGVNDGADNCPDQPNVDQRDEDEDDVGNVCDNCPHVVNADQANDGEEVAGETPDTAGDVCDPSPASPGNDLLHFEGFDDPDVLDDWSTSSGSWTVSGGALRMTTQRLLTTAYLRTVRFEGVAVATRVELLGIPPSNGPADTNRAFGTLVAYSPAADAGAGYLCLDYFNPAAVTPPTGTTNVITLRGSQPYQVEGSLALGDDLEEGAAYDTLHVLEVGDGALDCRTVSTALPQPISVDGTDNTYVDGFIGVRLQYVTAAFPYVVAFAVPPAN